MEIYVERFNLKKLNVVKVKEQNQVKFSDGCAALENVAAAAVMMMMMMVVVVVGG
jgi:hypothetical protein